MMPKKFQVKNFRLQSVLYFLLVFLLHPCKWLQGPLLCCLTFVTLLVTSPPWSMKSQTTLSVLIYTCLTITSSCRRCQQHHAYHKYCYYLWLGRTFADEANPNSQNMFHFMKMYILFHGPFLRYFPFSS